MQQIRAEIVHADALTCLGHGESLRQALLAGRSGLSAATSAFPGEDGVAAGGMVGVLPGVHGAQRLPQIFDLCFSQIVPPAFFASEMVIGACSLGDLSGPHAGQPRLALQQQLQQRWPQGQPVPPMSLVSSACSSGTDALIMASQVIQAGLADIVSVLAFDSLEAGKLIQHIALGTQSGDRARPFDLRRSGTSFGEAAALMIITSPRGRMRLGLPVLAQVAGFGMSSDAWDIAAPLPGGRYAAQAVAAAIAGIDPTDIGYINAHGSGTLLNDNAECEALHLALGEHAARIAIGSTKGALGHSLGATGLVEAVLTTQALVNGIFPPSAMLETPDPQFDLRLLQVATQIPSRYAMSLTFGFGGVNSAILLEVA